MKRYSNRRADRQRTKHLEKRTTGTNIAGFNFDFVFDVRTYQIDLSRQLEGKPFQFSFFFPFHQLTFSNRFVKL